ncbi:hypothetical protein AcV5_004235 [Taiwanofungus camphoratus]|nr:hypothetical protein AcV5_004235 [Antrodia cinnamomea]
MANIEIQDLSEQPREAGDVNGVQEEGSSVLLLSNDGGGTALVEKSEGEVEASPISPSPVPSPASASGLNPSRASPANGLPSGSMAAPILSMPHPKKFSHININKKFLEKTSASPSGQVTSTSATTKGGNSIQKPVFQTAPSHSRLVTTKLTASPQPPTTTGPGWSRPPSSTPSAAPPPSTTTLKSSTLPASASSHSAPLPAPVGKVIQPQPKGLSDVVGSVKRDGLNKTAWGNAKSTSIVTRLDAVANDFPTAAEVAQGRTTKVLEKTHAAQVAAAQKQAVAAEEDTFRGVHLDPNAHHWDEMEEDDDNFLGGVIEFGDGRQYKIQPADLPRQSSPPRELPDLATDGEVDSMKQSETLSLVDQPVSKEERFADDFDRSWPRSRIMTGFSHQQREQFSNGPASAASSQSMHSPQEASRVLFNERSNRLEPYSSSHPSHRPGSSGPGPFLGRRGSRSEYAVSPTESRNVRDIPPHPHTQGVQLLQKAPTDPVFHSRVVGDHSGSFPTSSHEGPRLRDRELSRREPTLPAAHDMSRTPSQRLQSRNKDNYNPYGMPLSPVGSRPGLDTDDRPRRSGTMGPPPLPLPPSKDSIRNIGRQLPPHLSDTHQLPPPLRATTAVEGKEPPAKSSPNSLASISPGSTEKQLQSSAMPLVDIEEVRKAAMHSAAERAKLRRQQEEEEREREKERARRKAAEMEERMKESQERQQQAPPEGTKNVTEAQVVQIIEAAVQSVQPNQSETTTPDKGTEHLSQVPEPTSLVRPAFAGAPSSKRTLRSPPNQINVAKLSTDTLSSAAEADSWRSKAVSARSTTPQSSVSPTAPASLPPPPLFAEVASLAVKLDEDLEVVDFSELGKLVGAETIPQSFETRESVTLRSLPVRPCRSVASDFFDEHTPGVRDQARPARIDEGSWRRKPMDESSVVPDSTVTASAKGKLRVQILAADTSRPNALSSTVDSHSIMSSNSRYPEEPVRSHSSLGQSAAVPANLASQKSPLTPSYREAPMSALDDTLSRIKGALDGMHTKTEPAKPQKWLPPALRPKPAAPPHSDEVFDVTGHEPPRSPRPWNVYDVKFPRISRPLEQIPKNQLQLFNSQSCARLDISSWNFASEGTYQRYIPPNDILFRRVQFHRGRPRYYVSIPRTWHNGLRAIVEEGSKPVVNLPPKSTVIKSPHSISRETERLSGWRKPVTPSPSVKDSQTDDTRLHLELDTVSRSPPPETLPIYSNAASLPKSEGVPLQVANGTLVKSRSQPKMPAGSDVAFYRAARADATMHPKTAVKFIVTSELEDEHPSQSNGAQRGSAATSVSAPDTSSNADPSNRHVLPAQRGPTELSLLPLADVKVEAVRSSLPLERAVITPPPQSSNVSRTKSPRAFTTKDSPARPPDPEHLKALWSQTSDKAELPSVNSLEGIADDLTAVPFTLQDVKSEDGETPPPSGSGPPSRMSLHEVTRAFQQVPSPSVNSPRRSDTLPPLTSPPNGVVARPNFAFTPSLPNNSMRPTYGYPSPLLNHSPSPTVMYSHHMAPSPVPRPMVVNGASPSYPQPMWMPVPGSSTQAPGTMIRALTSPYPAQLMAYPSPSGQLPMYPPPPPPGMQGASSQAANGAHGRNTGMSMMSPVMQPAHSSHPMYASSPALMHSPSVLSMPPGHGYPPGSVQPHRGQHRGHFDPTPGVPAMSPSVSHPPHQPSPYAVAPNSFPRPTW